MNIFVGNLSFSANENDLKQAFMAYGAVLSASIVMEKKGLKSRGFGFVQMPNEQEAQAAIAGLNGQEILGRPVDVLPALSKEPKVIAAKKTGRYLSARPDRPARPDSPLRRTGRYKQGRRSLSYAKKRFAAGLPEPVFKRKPKSNPLRWRKQSRFAKFKPREEFKPRGKFKPKGEFQPQGELKPQGEFEPKGEFRPKKEFKPKERSKPWIKSGNGFRPWHKKIYDQGRAKFKKRGR